MNTAEHLNAALAGRYRVEREIGAGGMATVYVARDVKHDRPVALKLLRPELGAVLGVERFLAEIRVTAHLHHPNLLPLFDSGEAEGFLFYVMPFVDGESLRARLEREKQLPIDEAIRITARVADALDYAHRHGVVHRDLKPENILLEEGHPTVADFGIALAVSNAGGARITQTGLSLGTPQYMSPEQATGDRQLDGRTDIYSLGCVLYEMLTGEPPHTGPTVQSIIARVLTDKPRSVRVTRESVPAHVDAAIQKALAKLPADRFATARQFAEVLENGRTATAPTAATPPLWAPSRVPAPVTRRWPRRPLSFLLWLLVASAIGWAARTTGREPAAPGAPTTRFTVAVPHVGADLTPTPIALSPDGSLVVFVGRSASGSQLYARALDDPDVKPIAGTTRAIRPFFSPDGKWIAFFADGQLKKVPAAGGAPTTITNVAGYAEGTWSPNGVIVFSRRDQPGLWRVSAAGGVPQRLTTPDRIRGEVWHFGPHFLPDGTTLLFTRSRGTRDDSHLGVVSLDGRVTLLDQVGMSPAFARTGHLLWTTGGGILTAAPFDPRRRAITGPSVPIVDRGYRAASGVAVSPGGTLAYWTGEPVANLVLVDRSGAMRPLEAEGRVYRSPRVSPNGTRIAMEIASDSSFGSDIWIYHLTDATLTRLTFDGRSGNPVWTPDGKRITFTSRPVDSDPDIYWQPADGSGPAERLVGGPMSQSPHAWTPDRGTLVFTEPRPGRRMDILAVTVDRNRIPHPILATEFNERIPRLAPDGRWMAYTSDESGRVEIYVRPFPGPGGRWQVSTQGGNQPVWSRDGRELFYRDGARVIAATIRTSPTFAVTGRRPLFEDAYVGSNTVDNDYDVLPDGRFALIKSAGEGAQLIVVANWFDELRRRFASAGQP
jgi:Tol biopolymer transport system component